MQLIRSVYIRYLRSIHRLRLNKIGHLTVFSGANDVGKSNLLKALNLFFNNEVDWHTPMEFYRDFSLRRLDEVRRESVKGKQFVSIDIEFNRPDSYRGSLPPVIRVRKTWLRDSSVPQEDNNLERQQEQLPSTLGIAKRMLSRFLNRVHFEYVPAIRDRAYYEHALQDLQNALIPGQVQADDPILRAVESLNSDIAERAAALGAEFEEATGVKADVSLPTNPRSLFKAFSVNTRWQSEAMAEAGEQQELPLILRGDGIQALYVPSLLNYIAESSSQFWIWGFEEPENSVEYNLAIDLAELFRDSYSKNAQVFITSHSPAFMSLQGPGVVSYRVHKTCNTTQTAVLYPAADDDSLYALSEDLGLFRIQKELYEKYVTRREELLQMNQEVEALRVQLAASTMPVVYLEGKTDAEILNTAWTKLFPNQVSPCDFACCDPLPEGAAGGAGGTDTLAKFLSTVRDDSRHLAIGVFDHDLEGCRSYDQLPQYFTERAIGGVNIKVSQNRKAVALLLPTPPDRQEYADFGNFSIEYHFDDEYLDQRTVEGFGLEFRQPNIQRHVNMPGRPIVIDEDQSSLPHTRGISSGKTTFAEEIVPNLPSDAFGRFSRLFVVLGEIIEEWPGV